MSLSSQQNIATLFIPADGVPSWFRSVPYEFLADDVAAYKRTVSLLKFHCLVSVYLDHCNEDTASSILLLSDLANYMNEPAH